jgi:hypothetical protein
MLEAQQSQFGRTIMAVSQAVFDMTLVAEEDLSTSQFCAVTLGTNANTCKICEDTDVPIGILQNKPTEGQEAQVRMLGTSKVKANGAFSKLDELMVADTDGTVDTATSVGAGGEPTWSVGVALEAATAPDDIIEMYIRPQLYGSGSGS